MRLPLLIVLLALCVALSFSSLTIEPSAAISASVQVTNARDTLSRPHAQQSSPVRGSDTMTATPSQSPQQATKRTLDVTGLRAEAAELSALARAVPDQIEKVGNGQLPKELVENLRRIEKISKRIRGEIS